MLFLKRKTKETKKGFCYKSFLRNLFSDLFKYLQERNSFESKKKFTDFLKNFMSFRVIQYINFF